VTNLCISFTHTHQEKLLLMNDEVLQISTLLIAEQHPHSVRTNTPFNIRPTANLTTCFL